MQLSVFTVSLLILAALHGVLTDDEDDKSAGALDDAILMEFKDVKAGSEEDENGDKGSDNDPSPRRAQQMEKEARYAPGPVLTSHGGGDAGSAYCVDMTDSFVGLPETHEFRYRRTKRTPADKPRCRQQGILYVKPKPDWARSLSIHMEFERPKDYTFNIGDAHDNNGFGGGSYYHNAEIFGRDSRVRAYKNRGGNEEKFFDKKVAKRVLFLRIYQHEFYATDYTTYRGFVYPGGYDKFFWFHGHKDYIYIGLNRVIREINGKPKDGRDGRGLCNICVWWNP